MRVGLGWGRFLEVKGRQEKKEVLTRFPPSSSLSLFSPFPNFQLEQKHTLIPF